jgi:hypothetical protein
VKGAEEGDMNIGKNKYKHVKGDKKSTYMSIRIDCEIPRLEDRGVEVDSDAEKAKGNRMERNA